MCFRITWEICRPICAGWPPREIPPLTQFYFCFTILTSLSRKLRSSFFAPPIRAAHERHTKLSRWPRMLNCTYANLLLGEGKLCFFPLHFWIYIPYKGIRADGRVVRLDCKSNIRPPYDRTENDVCFFQLNTGGDNDRALKVHAISSCAKLFPPGVPFFLIQ